MPKQEPHDAQPQARRPPPPLDPRPPGPGPSDFLAGQGLPRSSGSCRVAVMPMSDCGLTIRSVRANSAHYRNHLRIRVIGGSVAIGHGTSVCRRSRHPKSVSTCLRFTEGHVRTGSTPSVAHEGTAPPVARLGGSPAPLPTPAHRGGTRTWPRVVGLSAACLLEPRPSKSSRLMPWT